VGCFRAIESGRRQRSALRIWSRSAWMRIRGGASDAGMSGLGRGDVNRLHEEGPQRMLEGGDGTVAVGKGGLEMGEDLRRRPLRGFGRRLGWRAAAPQCRADLALALVEAFPDAPQGPVTQMVGSPANGTQDAAGGGELEESPQTAGCQAEPSDLVGDPDAEGPPATATCLAVATEDSPGAHRL